MPRPIVQIETLRMVHGGPPRFSNCVGTMNLIEDDSKNGSWKTAFRFGQCIGTMNQNFMSLFRLKPRRGGPFIDTRRSGMLFSFCFSAARLKQFRVRQSGLDVPTVGQLIQVCAAEKQKDNPVVFPGYKRATPTGFQSFAYALVP